MTQNAAGQANFEHPKEPLAILGIGCRFPGEVDSPESFWQLLCNEVDAITEIPADRFDVEAFYDSRPATPGKIMTRWGGFVNNIDQFDAYFFGISPREADRMDPQQRLLLEVSWEALEDAGQSPDRLTGSQTGVFMGLWLNDYEARLFENPDGVDFYMTTGSGRYSASGRLSYAFGFQGPSLTVDTACSSSLVAVHLACQSLWSGECDLALAGGANAVLQPHITIAYSQSKMMSPDGRCKFGDARANGYVRSDGAGVIVLKRLSQALADGDPIVALIRGSAVNNDGRSSGFLTTPGSAGQEEMLRQAYANAGISPGQVQYVEAHGTGTLAGDPVEIQALGAVLAQDRPKDQPCRIGSVKTNIGHTEGAAGVAGLIKVALSLKHRMIPASLHVQELNPNIPWHELPLLIQRELSPWPDTEGPAIGGVSAFGIAGTNAHVVLQEAALPPTPSSDSAPNTACLLPLSAHTPEALRALTQRYQQFLAADSASSLRDLSYTASVRRTHHDHRLAVVGRSREELIERLESVLGEDIPSTQLATRRKVVFVFPGQGSQWLGMGRQLLAQEPAFRKALENCERTIKPYVADWSLLEQLTAPEGHSRLDEIDVIQPTLFAIEVALAELWKSWGIEPDAVVGHSMGEVAAAYIAGALRLEDAARIICRRSQLMKRVSGQGAMAVVELSLPEAQTALAGYEGRLGIAVSNGPRSTVLSGDPAALAEVMDTLKRRDVFCRPVKVDVAAHSPQMEPLQAELVPALSAVRPQSGLSQTSIPIYSTVTGEVIEAESLDAVYWGRNLREPVLFSTAVQHLLADGLNTFIEMSPHPILLPAIERGLRPSNGDEPTDLVTLPSMRREADERAVMLESFGALYRLGHPVDWRKLYPAGGRCVRLPAYAWQRERFWFDETDRTPSSAKTPRQGLLGEPLQSSVHAETYFWETELTLEAFPYLADHRVRGSVVLPAAAYVEMALSAANEIFNVGAHILEQITFTEALLLSEPRTVQLVVTPQMSGNGTAFQILSRPSNQPTVWTGHASGTMRIVPTDRDVPAVHDSPEVIRSRTSEVAPGAEHYRRMSARGLEYGPAFQGITQFWQREGEALGQLHLPASVASDAVNYQIHPALLDACFQLLVATEAINPRDPYLPVGAESVRLYQPPSTEAWAYAVRKSDGDLLEGDVTLLSDDGQVLLEVKGLRLQRLAAKQEQTFNLSDVFYEIRWQPYMTPEQVTHENLQGVWLIFADVRTSDGVGKTLASQLGDSILVSPGEEYRQVEPGRYQLHPRRAEDFSRLLKEAFTDRALPCRGIVHLWSLDAAAPGGLTFESLEQAHQLGWLSSLHLVQALAQTGWAEPPQLWLVTSGAQAVGPDVQTVSSAQTPLWGLGGVITHEHPELRCTRVDLSAETHPAEIQSLVQAIQSNDSEDQIALRGSARFVARLAKAPVTSNPPSPGTRPSPLATQSYRVEITKPGILDNLTLCAISRRAPAPGQVEIEVRATGLNFMNVMSGLGVLPGYADGVGPLGIECAGVIAAVGEGVDDLKIGDEVLAIAYDSLGSHALAEARLTLLMPPQFSFEQAAAIPIVFVTAYYALHHLAHLQPGERVLIHAAAGGVGLAAIQLARRAGAEIIATVGSPEKRDYLRSLGVERIFDSRSLAFADEIMTATNGEGVDVVLNSLAGEAIPKGLSILKPYGRFVEIGKRDIYQNSQVGLWPFQKNLSYFAVDLDRMCRERPDFVGRLFREVMGLFAEGALAPVPLRTFPIAEVTEAFRHMAQARHIGKIVVTPQLENTEVVSNPRSLFLADATYLISGGLGGLGLSVAQWMVERGARALALIGRSEPSAAASEAIEALEGDGAQVKILRADVAQETELRAALAEIARAMPPLRGVIHAAGILDDGILLQQNEERFRAVMAPKVQGAWNLHTLTLDRPLDFFVLFSSVASLLGTPGQGNYAAANAFMDGLAHHRRVQGLPALSINWGPWAQIGLAAQRERGNRLALQGLSSLTPEQGLQALARVLYADQAQVGVMPLDMRQWLAAHPADARSSLFADLASELSRLVSAEVVLIQTETKNGSVRDALLAAEPGRRRRAVLETYIREQAAQVLRLSPSRIDLHKSLRTLGFDSLMTLEFRNRMEAGLGLTLPATLVWNYPTVAELAPHLASKMGIPLEAEAKAPLPSNREAAEALGTLPTDEVEKMLAEELDSLDELLRGSK